MFIVKTLRYFLCLTSQVVLVTAALLSGGCSFSSHSSSSTGTIAVRSELEQLSCYSPALLLGYPLVLTSIGVSHYGDKAGVWSTPAHSLSAAIFHQPFRVAADRTKIRLRNKKVFDDYTGPILVGPEQTINAIAVDQEGARLAVSHSDKQSGVVVVWSSRGVKLAQITLPVPAKKLRFLAGELIVVLDEKETVSVVRFDGSVAASMRHASPVKSFDVAERQRAVLTVTGDNFIHVLDSDTSKLTDSRMTDPGECSSSESGSTYARFTPSGDKILVTRCDAIEVYRLDVQRRATLAESYRTSQEYPSMEISPDGDLVLSVANTGDIRVHRKDKVGTDEVVGGLKISTRYGPRFSGDGSAVLLTSSEGFARVFDTRSFRTPPIVVDDYIRGSVEMSKNGRYLVMINHNRVLAWDLSAYEKYGDLRVARAMRLDYPLLGTGLPEWKPTTIGITNDGLAWIGDKSGLVLGYGAATTSEIESRFVVQTELDLYTLPIDDMLRANFDPVIITLKSIGGMDWLGDTLKLNLAAKASRPTITKERIIDALELAIIEAENTYKQSGKVLLILYVSGHGWNDLALGPVLLPADAVDSKPETWITYKSVLDRVEQFVGNNSSKHALIIIDTCQTPRGERSTSAAVIKPTNKNVLLLQSTSPGQYAWQWLAETRFTQNRTIVNESRWGFPSRPKAIPRGETKGTLTPSKMSALAIASTCALSRTTRQALFDSKVLQVAKLTPEDGTLPGPDLARWLSGTKREFDDLLSKIPEVKEADRVQTLNLDGGPGAEEILDLKLFQLEFLLEESKEGE